MASRNITGAELDGYDSLKIGMSELLEQIVARNGVPVDKAIATYSRIRNFRRLDFPKIERAGKGREDRLSLRQAQMLNMAVALNIAGVPPEKAARLVNDAAEGTDLSGDVHASFDLRSEMSGESVGIVMLRATKGPAIGIPAPITKKPRLADAPARLSPSALPAVREIGVVMFPDGRMDRANAARYVGFSVKTLAMHAGDGTGPKFQKIGGRVFYRRDDLDEWIGSHATVTSTAQSRIADDLLDGADAAANYIGITPRQVYRMTESGQLPVIRKGRRLFYRKSDLEAAFR